MVRCYLLSVPLWRTALMGFLDAACFGSVAHVHTIFARAQCHVYSRAFAACCKDSLCTNCKNSSLPAPWSLEHLQWGHATQRRAIHLESNTSVWQLRRRNFALRLLKMTAKYDFVTLLCLAPRPCCCVLRQHHQMLGVVGALTHLAQMAKVGTIRKHGVLVHARVRKWG